MALQDNFNAAELARSAALEDAKNENFVGQLVSIDYDDQER